MSKLFCLPIIETDFYEMGDDPNFIYIEIDFLLEKSIQQTFKFLKDQKIFGTLDIENESMTKAINLISHLNSKTADVIACDNGRHLKTLQIIHTEDQQSIASLIQPHQCLHTAPSTCIQLESLINYKKVEPALLSCSHPSFKSPIDCQVNLFSGEITIKGARHMIDATELSIFDDNMNPLLAFNNPHFEDRLFLTPISLFELRDTMANSQDSEAEMCIR